MFVWPKNDLNAEQVAAITEPGSVFLVACPGSGKTRALTYKIALELSKLTTNKEWVVAITYTNRAADEIHERVERLGVDTSQLWIGTIHAFCLEWILRPYALYHPDLEHGFRVIDSHDTERMFAELCRGTPERLRPFECNYYFTSEGLRLEATDRRRHQAINRLLEEYWARLRADRQLDFELILYYAYELISTVSSIKTLLGSLFAWVLVDEFQDTKEIQYAILGAILKSAGGRAAAFLVGDPNQAIYGSLGGYAISRAAFADLSGLELTEKGLVINYRSSQRIVDYFVNYHVHPAPIVAEGRDKDYASLISFDRGTMSPQLAGELVRLIRFNIETVGIKPHEMCVIAPWWIHLASITRRLVAALPEYSFDGPGIAPFARDIENFWYKVARIVLTEPSPQLYVRRLRWAGEVLAALDQAAVDTGDLSRKSLLRECNSIHIEQNDGLTYLREVFDLLFARLKIDFHAVPTLAEHHAAFFESSATRIERLVREGGVAFAEIVTFRKVFATRTGITVSTIHGVKGAEYDSVIAYALLEGMVPHFADDNQLEAAKRLLYVVCSRARKNLHLVSESGRVDGRGQPYEATRILAACQFAYDDIPSGPGG
jgi:DNA helicase-2/ATP-dependent DNA helicase PcrA